MRTCREPVYCVNCHLSAMTSGHGQLPPNIYSTCATLSQQTRNKIDNTKSITELLKADRVYWAPVPRQLCRHSHHICILTFIAADIFIFPVFYYTGRVFFFYMYIYKYHQWATNSRETLLLPPFLHPKSCYSAQPN